MLYEKLEKYLLKDGFNKILENSEVVEFSRKVKIGVPVNPVTEDKIDVNLSVNLETLTVNLSVTVAGEDDTWNDVSMEGISADKFLKRPKQYEERLAYAWRELAY